MELILTSSDVLESVTQYLKNLLLLKKLSLIIQKEKSIVEHFLYWACC